MIFSSILIPETILWNNVKFSKVDHSYFATHLHSNMHPHTSCSSLRKMVKESWGRHDFPLMWPNFQSSRSWWPSSSSQRTSFPTWILAHPRVQGNYEADTKLMDRRSGRYAQSKRAYKKKMRLGITCMYTLKVCQLEASWTKYMYFK